MMPVVAWTPNNRSEIVPLIEMGVDGFITNEPGNVLGFVADFVAGKLNPATTTDAKFSVSDLVWVCLGGAGTPPSSLRVRVCVCACSCVAIRLMMRLGSCTSAGAGVVLGGVVVGAWAWYRSRSQRYTTINGSSF
jgi:hypothetical protein